MAPLPSVDEARQRLLGLVTRSPSQQVPLAQALGRALRGPVRAGRDQPPFDSSAMDGWAVKSEDGRQIRKIVGESAAGHPYPRPLARGEAVRIFTGAAVPPGADRVIIQEEARREGDALHVADEASGSWIRARGMDFRAGQTLLEPSLILDPWRLSLAAAAGHDTLKVAARPRVAVLSTGEEIVQVGGAPDAFQIFDSGGPAVAALAGQWGAEAEVLSVVGDDERNIAAAVDSASVDLIVTLGGASVGDHDLVKPALRRLGLELVVDGVAMRPGKPAWGGRLGDGRLVLGLPGNPASALVCAELFLWPMLRQFLGLATQRPLEPAVLAADLPPNGLREQWMRVKLSRDDEARLLAEPFLDQDSSLVSVFARADALLRRDAGASAASVGDRAAIMRLERAS